MSVKGRILFLLLGMVLFAIASGAVGQTTNFFPGGWIEKDGAGMRSRYSTAQLQSFIPPQRGAFTFPSPYNTRGIRITDASDCGGADCVWYVGYSYWRNTNAHQNSNDMLIFLGLASNRGGAGPTLFKLDKSTDAITKVGPLFPSGSKYRDYTGEGWYFSASRQNALYLNDGPKMFRYDVVTQQFETVFDVTGQFGADRRIWQMHSSNDDLVHSATLRVASTGEMLGCLVYLESTKQFRWYPKAGGSTNAIWTRAGAGPSASRTWASPTISPCEYSTTRPARKPGLTDRMGRSGIWTWDMDMPSARTTTMRCRTLLSSGHSILRLSKGRLSNINVNWNIAAVNHISHTNSKPNVPSSQQHACGSDASTNYAVQNEITCFRIDNTHDQLIVAPVMTDPNASGGCCDFYARQPKGNLDITGRYFIWTTNLGGNRMDAFLVKVPSQLLVSGGDLTPPAAPVNLRLQ